MRILVAFDNSEVAKKALEHAKNLMEKDDELIIALVIPPLEDKIYEKISPDIKVSEARTILEGVVDGLKKQSINARSVLEKGDVADKLLEIGSKLECKLIVIGYKGITKIGRFSLGSIADKVSRKADRPVLIIK